MEEGWSQDLRVENTDQLFNSALTRRGEEYGSSQLLHVATCFNIIDEGDAGLLRYTAD
jgi:hypothetical protein